MLRGLATVTYFADELAEAKRWYTDLLGVAPYYAFPTEEAPAYLEFRIGDYAAELGLLDRRYAPPGASGPTGAIIYWHVDDVAATVRRLLDLGATEHDPITERGDGDFVTASVVDPFGNILGVMYNPHYLEILAKGA